MIEENAVGETPATQPEETEQTAAQEAAAQTTPDAEAKERTYTKNEVIEMMRKRVNRSHQAFFNRYKVKDLSEMDTLFNKVGDYEKQIADLGVTNAGLIKDNAYLKNNINPERYGDIEAYFKGKGLKIDSDTLAQEIATHPEWLKVILEQPKPKTTIKTISPERGHQIVETDDERMKRVFGV